MYIHVWREWGLGFGASKWPRPAPPRPLSQGKGADGFVEPDPAEVLGYLASNYAWAAKALANYSTPASLPGAAALLSQLALAATAAAAPAEPARAPVAGAARGRGREREPGAAAGGAPAAAASPWAAARAVLEAVKGDKGYGALPVDVREALAVAELAVARREAAAR